MISPYSVPNIIGVLSIALVGLIVFLKNRKSLVSLAFFLLCFELIVWLGSYAITYSTSSKQVAYFFCRVACTSVMFTTPTIYLFFARYLKKFESEKKWIYFCFSVMFIMFPFFVFTKIFLGEPIHYPWGYYSSAGLLHPLYIIIWAAVWCRGLTMFFDKKLWDLENQFQRNRNKIALVLYFVVTLGFVDYIPKYGINWYPYGWMAEVIFAFLVAYAIVKYKFIDISLAITRTGIFIAVYSLVLGIPFALAFGWQKQLQSLIGETWWLAPLISSTVLATIGPSIYLFIQRKAEDKLLQEQRQYQATLRRASLGMGRIKDLNRLLKLTVNIITRNVQIEHAAIYLTHPASGRYILKALKGREVAARKHMFIPGDSPLVAYLKRYREPLVYDELKQRSQDFQDKNLVEVCQTIEELHGALLIPSFIEEDLIAIVVLGNKKSGKLYSHDDLVVFSILANQAALGIENAQFYEEMKKTHEQLMKAEKMATIGTMADGLSHQINNRLHAMGFITGDLLDTIKLKRTDNMPPETKALLDEAEHSLGRIQDNVKRGGEIVEGLLKYSRKADEGLTAVDLNKLLDAAIEMAQFKIKINQIDIIRDFSPSLSKIRGNFTQLQEVFFNMIDNAYDAMMERKEGMKEPAYRGRLEISAKEDGNNLEILLRDNGIGVKDKDFKRLFTPFFTTKITSKKGTGLGLYVIRKIIEENHGGKVEFTSEYQKGSQTRLLLPAFQVGTVNTT